MPTDTTIDTPSILVTCVAGDKSKPISEQAPAAVDELETAMPTLQGIKFFGVVVDGEYRACVRVNQNNELGTMGYPPFTIPGGRYVHRQLIDWDHDIESIGQTVDELLMRPDYDSTRYVIEHYRSHTEIVIRVPVV
jgi:hypothetical protein